MFDRIKSMIKISLLIALPLLMCLGCAVTRNTSPTTTRTVAGKVDEIYIPTDLNDCFVQLKKLLKPEDINNMRNSTEDDMIMYHLGLGMWMRNNWGLWGGSRLARWFNAQGIKHPDDMSGIILDSFWRHLNNKPIKLDEQIKYYQDYWRKMRRSDKK